MTSPRSAPSATPSAAPLPPPARWKSALALGAYTTVLRLALPVLLARTQWRGRIEPEYAQRWAERIGLGYPYARLTLPHAQPLVWLHAVSLGETRACAPLVRALREALPGMRLLLTCTTATGWTAGEALLQPGDLHTWMPLDTPGAVRRFLQHHHPQVAVLMETEVWPQVQRQARALGLPVVLANARLSDKSLRQGQRMAPLLRPAAEAITVALAQTADDARRLRTMGVADVRVSGNLKFDVRPQPQQVARGQQWAQALGRPVLLFASSREGEEVGVIEAWAQRVAAMRHKPLLLLVPRHPQRFDEVAKLVSDAGLRLARRSGWGDTPAEADLQADVWLGDSMGEMPLYYGVARTCLLGGSFAPFGAQNLIEAVASGCAVIMGPSTFNFEEAARLCEAAGAATRVNNAEAAVDLGLRQIALQAQGQGPHWADDWMAEHAGSAQRMAQAVSALVR